MYGGLGKPIYAGEGPVLDETSFEFPESNGLIVARAEEPHRYIEPKEGAANAVL
jgi:hypothetical protein